jgi:predicted ATPase
LQRELGVSPSQATQEAYERLLNMDTPRKIASPARVPLVARKESWAALQTAWRQTAVNQPNIVLLTGEAGIGKTRLAEELLDWTRRQGIPTLTAACYATEEHLPYAPIAAWLRADALQNSFDQLETRWLVECARLRPELLVQRPELTAPSPLTEGWQRQHFFTAVAHAILTLRQPLLLFIDDLQWCDQDSLDWLQFLLRFNPNARFLLLGTVRVEEVDSEHPLSKWQQSFHRAGTLTDVPLHRLNAAATNQLAAHVAQHSLDPDLAARLFAETEGNPLFMWKCICATSPELMD